MKSIILRDWEVRGILDGRLTQLRRVVKPQPMCEEVPENIGNDMWCGRYRVLGMDGEEIVKWDEFGPCPLGVPGEKRWVRETWQAIHVCIDPETGYGDDMFACQVVPASNNEGYWVAVYKATDHQADYPSDERGFSWRSPVLMPQWASRLTV